MAENIEQSVFTSSSSDDREGVMSDELRQQLDVTDKELLEDEAEFLRGKDLDDVVTESLAIVRAMTRAKGSFSE